MTSRNYEDTRYENKSSSEEELSYFEYLMNDSNNNMKQQKEEEQALFRESFLEHLKEIEVPQIF